MEKPVLVTTKHRGVFFGFMSSGESLPASVDLKKVRNCLYWSRDCGGFLGLASKGPSSECRIGQMAETITLYDVTSITDVSEEAKDKWLNA